MNITEANDLNVVLDYVLNLSDATGNVPSDDTAREAAARLADRANKALGAGLTGDRVNAAWPELLLDNDSGTVWIHTADMTVCEDPGPNIGTVGECRHGVAVVVRDARDWQDDLAPFADEAEKRAEDWSP